MFNSDIVELHLVVGAIKLNKEYSITIDGQPVTFEFKDSLIHAEGSHAGNIDAIITTRPPLPQNLLLDELHIKIPGTNEYLYIYGYGAVENSLKATFNSSKLVDKQNLPEKVEVYWGSNGEQLIGEMNCMPYSEKAEHELDDEIIEQIAPEESERTTEVVSVVKEESERTTQVVTDIKEEEKLKKKTSSNTKWMVIGIVVLIIVIASILFL